MTIFRIIFLQVAALLVAASIRQATAASSPPNNVHAMIVSSSRYWFNYRHAINALGIYDLLRTNGIPDDRIILMVADEYATNSRNPYKNRMHASGIHRESWYGGNATELDYRGSDVTVQTFLDASLGVAPKSLHTDAESNLLIYVTGHGGDQFFKFQDEEELTAQDIANLLDRLHQDKKYKNVLFIADTCQAFTLLRGENAYAHHSDKDLGLAAIERWTFAFLNAYKTKSTPQTTLYDIMAAPFQTKAMLGAQVGILENDIKFQDFKLHDFFGEKDGAKKPRDERTVAMPTVSRIEVSQRRLSNDPFGPTNAAAEEPIPAKKEFDTKSSQNENATDDRPESGLLFPLSVLISILVVAATIEKKVVRWD
jgi:phosphatidylinositol glycan class K